MQQCIFCKIIRGEIPAQIEYQDENVVVLHDINPQAPVHLLILPKRHIENICEIKDEDSYLLVEIFKTIQKIVDKVGLFSGFRVVVNCKEEGGQTVPHLHFHLLGKRQMRWPPG